MVGALGHPATQFPGARARSSPDGHPFPTPAFPKARSAKDAARRPAFRMPTSRGGYPSPVTPNERRIPAHERAPKCVCIQGVASGQSPTDPYGAKRGRTPFGLRVLSLPKAKCRQRGRRPRPPDRGASAVGVAGPDSAKQYPNDRRPEHHGAIDGNERTDQLFLRFAARSLMSGCFRPASGEVERA